MRFPVKTLQFNKCPAVAPLGVLTEENLERLKIDLEVIKVNRAKLSAQKDLRDKLLKALQILNEQRQVTFLSDEKDVDNQLYDGFFNDTDKTGMGVVRAAGKDEIASVHMEFKDPRLQTLLPLYKARNFPKSLSTDEREAWEKFRYHKLMDGGVKSALNRYFIRLAELAKKPNLTSNEQYLIEELQLYGESIMPEDLDGALDE